MKSFSIPALTLCVLSLMATPSLADFSGTYAPGNWSASTQSGGTIDPSLAPVSISMTSGNLGGGPSNQDYTIMIMANGVVNFVWDYFTRDAGDLPGGTNPATYDPFGYLLNGNFFQLTVDSGSASQWGSESINVNNGDIFGFQAASLDSSFGSATTVISEFTGPEKKTPPVGSTVPEPSTMMLLGTGLLGLVAWRKKMVA